MTQLFFWMQGGERWKGEETGAIMMSQTKDIGGRSGAAHREEAVKQLLRMWALWRLVTVDAQEEGIPGRCGS